MTRQRIEILWQGEEPAVTQAVVNGWQLSWNPDDGRWYAERGDEWLSRKDWRNIVQAARQAGEAP